MSFTPDELLANNYCVSEVSKNIDGQMIVLDADRRVCTRPPCEPLVLSMYLRLNATPGGCDSNLGTLLDGSLRVRDLVAVFSGPREGLRGVHASTFAWLPTAGGRIKGVVEGISNAGILHPPVSKCEPCDQSGVLTGHIFGSGNNVPGFPVPDFNVEAVYRFAWDPNSTPFSTSPVQGTIEGVVILPCA